MSGDDIWQIEMWRTVITVLGAIGGLGAVIAGISAWLGKIWADRLAEIHKQKLQFEMSQNLRFIEKQFDLYISLWDKLQDLRFAADKLWQDANQENIIVLGEALQQVSLFTEKVSLFTDNDTYQRLRNVITNIENFSVGKRNLIELRTSASIKRAYDEYSKYGGNAEEIHRQIRQQIDWNRNYRDEYENLLNTIRRELQSKLAGNSNTDYLQSRLRNMVF